MRDSDRCHSEVGDLVEMPGANRRIVRFFRAKAEVDSISVFRGRSTNELQRVQAGSRAAEGAKARSR
jgi:hypothetical protein